MNQKRKTQGISRIDMPKFPTGFHFAMSKDVVFVDFCVDTTIPRSEGEAKTSFSTIVLTKDLARNLIEGLNEFIEESE